MSARTIGSLFSGIGGLELGLERAGLGRVVWQVERDPFCRAVLAKHWPSADRSVEDVHHAGSATLVRVDVVCGGFPCQPASVAGKRLGQDDPRWLWPQFARVVRELCPAVVIAENVRGLRTAGLRDVLADLAELGFDAEWTCRLAAELGAPHERPRFWIVAAHPDRVGLRLKPRGLERAFESARAPFAGDDAAAGGGNAADAVGDPKQPHAERQGDALHNTAPSRSALTDADCLRGLESARRIAEQRGWAQRVGWKLADVAGVDDGVPVRMGAARKAYGNAVVVQAAQVVGEYVRDLISERGAA